MNTRTLLVSCAVVCLIVMAASVTMAAPYKIYEEQRAGGSVYYIGAIVGDTCYTGQLSKGAQQWGDEQINGTALLNHSLETEGRGNWGKCSLPLGGYIYSTDGAFDMRRQSAWGETSVAVLPTGQWAPDAICTDGTYIYATQGSSGAGKENGTNVIYKFAIDHAANTLTRLAMWSRGTASDHRFRAISYYNGKLYVANHKAAGGQIYEVDPTTGAFTVLATKTTAADSHYQAVRYGDQIFVVGLDCNLYTFTKSGATWSLTSTDPTGYTQNGAYGLFGIGVKGDGTTAKYAWISAPALTGFNPRMSFWDLSPWAGTPAHFGERVKNGYPLYVDEAVVTATVDFVDGANPARTMRGFWVESKGRTTGAYVAWTGDLPATNTMVTIKGAAGTTDSGEKTITATDVAPSGQYAVTPVFTTNKNLGPATGSAGLANDGMLVKVSGKMTGFDSGGLCFYIDDGTGAANDTPNAGTPAACKGIKIGKIGGDFWSLAEFLSYSNGPYPAEATVIGIVRLEKLTDGTIIRRVDARSDADVVITAL